MKKPTRIKETVKITRYGPDERQRILNAFVERVFKDGYGLESCVPTVRIIEYLDDILCGREVNTT